MKDPEMRTINFLIAMIFFLLLIITYTTFEVVKDRESCPVFDENYKFQHITMVSESGLTWSWWMNTNNTFYVNGVELR